MAGQRAQGVEMTPERSRVRAPTASVLGGQAFTPWGDIGQGGGGSSCRPSQMCTTPLRIPEVLPQRARVGGANPAGPWEEEWTALTSPHPQPHPHPSPHLGQLSSSPSWAAQVDTQAHKAGPTEGRKPMLKSLVEGLTHTPLTSCAECRGLCRGSTSGLGQRQNH